MKSHSSPFRPRRWISFPGALLIVLLQRAPIGPVAAVAEGWLAASPIGAVLRSAATAAVSLGAMHALAGATQFVLSRSSPFAATVGESIVPITFTYNGTPSAPASYRVVGSLPPGLAFIPPMNAAGVVNSSTPFITGTPTQAGRFSISVQGYNAANATGFTNDLLVPLTFNVTAAAASPPVIVAPPTSQSVPAGRPATLSVVATGIPAPSYQWSRNGAAIPGATGASLLIAIAQLSDAGIYAVTVSNSAGSASSGGATLAVTPNPLVPVFSAQPQAQRVAGGHTVVFSAEAGAGSRYQWRRDGVELAGETGAMLVLRGISVVAGSYSVVAANAEGAALSAAAGLTLAATADPGRLINLSVLALAGTGARVLTVGAVVAPFESRETLPLIVRAVGPTLALNPFAVEGALADPVLNLFATGGSVAIETNDDWGGTNEMAAAFGAAGAFPLPPGSRDSAIVRSAPGLTPGGYTVQVNGKGGASGTAIAEIYDAAGAARTATTPRLINLSSLTQVDNGATLAMGFVLGGQTARTVLVRAVGPSLEGSPFNQVGVMADPRLELFDNNSGRKIAENDNWGGAPPVAAVAASVAAFPLAAATTKDAALLVTLPPGQYSARVAGAGGIGGLVIIEAYEVP